MSQIRNMTLLKVMFVIFSVFQSSLGYSQITKTIDSLKNAANRDISDKEKVDTYIQLSEIYRKQLDSTNTIKWAKKAINLSKKVGYCEGTSNAYRNKVGLYNHLGWYDLAKQQLDSSIMNSKNCGYVLGEAYAFLGYGALMSLQSKYDEAITYYERSSQIAIKEEENLLLAAIYNNMSIAYYYQSDLDKTIEYTIKSHEIYMAFGDQRDVFESLRNLVSLYSQTGDYFEGLQNGLQAIRIAETMQDSIAIAWSLKGIADIYHSINEYSKAMSYIHRNIKIIRQTNNDKRRLMHSLNTLGIIHHELSNYDSALHYFKESLNIANHLKDGGNIPVFHNNLGLIHFDKGNLNSAEKHYKQALQIGSDVNTIATAHSGLGSIYLKKQSLEQAKFHLEKGLSYARESGMMETTKDILKKLSELETKFGNYKQALEYQMEFSIYYDSLLGEKKTKEFARLEIQYETEKKEKEIETLSQQATIQSLQLSEQKNQLWIGGLAALVIIATGFTYFSWDKNKKKKKTVELEQRFLRSQLNPHFIFNSMTAIQQYVLKKEPKQANNYINLFSTLMRQILENSREEFITLKEEVSMLKNYLELQLVRHENRFEYEIIIDKKLDELYTGIPPMFAQPFIENSLEHGLFKKDGSNNINIKFNYIDEYSIGLEIIDSGVGVSQTSTRVNHNSLASKITQERLATLSSQKTKAELKSKNIMNSNGEIEGLSVYLYLPSKLMFAP